MNPVSIDSALTHPTIAGFCKYPALVLLMFCSLAFAQNLPDQSQCRDLWQSQVRIKSEIEGWCLIIDQNKGNCIACHGLTNGTKSSSWPDTPPDAGNIGPFLYSAQEQFSDRIKLKRLIEDISITYPNSNMPLYGKHKILTQSEIDLIVTYLMTLGV